MSRPSLALTAALLGTTLAATGTFGQFFRRSATPAADPPAADRAPVDPLNAAPVDPMQAARGAYPMLRNGLDFLAYGEYERALGLLKEAESRQNELSLADQKRLKKAIAEAQQGLREGANPRRPRLARNRNLPRPGAIAALPSSPAPDLPSDTQRLAADPIQLAGATVTEPAAAPAAASNAAPGLAETAAQPNFPPAPIVEAAAPPAAQPVFPPAPIVEANPTMEEPVSAQPTVAAAVTDPLPPPLRIPDPGTSQKPMEKRNAPEPVVLTSGPPPAQLPPEPPPLPDDLPRLPGEPAAPVASEPPQALAVEPPQALAVEPPSAVIEQAAERKPDQAALSPLERPPSLGPETALPEPPVEPEPAAAAGGPLPADVPPPAASQPAEIPHEDVPAAEPAPSQPARLPEAGSSRTALPGVKHFGDEQLGGRFPLPRLEPVRSTLTPELQREVDRIAQRQEEERNTQRAAPVGPQQEAGIDTEQPTTRLELPRAPSPTEARPIRAIAVPDEFVPLAARSWDPTRKYWAAAATCHSPLYFQDAALERYGHSVEQFFGPNGRFLTYPVDDPTQSKQRNQIAQPFFSAGLFAFQILALPYNLVVDPPWEAEYDLGYYRPGDRIPPDIYYLPWTGVGPPLRGMNY